MSLENRKSWFNSIHSYYSFYKKTKILIFFKSILVWSYDNFPPTIDLLFFNKLMFDVFVLYSTDH